MAEKKYAKAEKAFVEYVKELLKALYDLTDEDLDKLAEQVAYKLEELKEEYEAASEEVDAKLQDLAYEYKGYQEYYGLSDKQMATLFKGAIRAEYNDAKKDFEDECAYALEYIKNMTLEDYKNIFDTLKAYRREFEDKVDDAKFEAYAAISELCAQFDEFKKENGLTQKEAVAFVEDALNQRFGKASEAYNKFRTEYLKARYNVDEETIAKVDKKMEAIQKSVENQYKAINAEIDKGIKEAFAEAKAQIPTDGQIVTAISDGLLGEIKKRL